MYIIPVCCGDGDLWPDACVGGCSHGLVYRYIPMVVENVRGAQPWVGRAKANFGSFYLWGDVHMVGKRIIAGAPEFGAGLGTIGRQKSAGNWFGAMEHANGYVEKKARMQNVPYVEAEPPLLAAGQKRNPDGTDHPQGSWFRIADSAQGDRGQKVPAYSDPRRNGGKGVHLTSPTENADGTKIGGDWFSDPQSTCRKHGSRSNARKQASAMIAKIPFDLAYYIACAFRPAGAEAPPFAYRLPHAQPRLSLPLPGDHSGSEPLF